MRILLLTQWFQPENFFKGLPFAKALAARGHDVEVLTGFPNYPGGKVYPGYRIRFYQRDTMDGILVHRVPLYPSHDKCAIRRILNYLTFTLSSCLLAPWLVKKPDVIYVYNLVTLGPPAFLLRFLFGAKVIIDVQDLWPESVANSRMLGNKTALRVLNRICQWIYRGTDLLTVLSPGFKKELTLRGVAADKIKFIYNWCDERCITGDALPAISKMAYGLSGKFVVLFAGAMGTAQGLDTVIDCAKLCRHSLTGVHFVLIGGGVDKPRLQEQAEEMELDNVTFLPPRPMEEMGEIYGLADVLLVHLKDDPLFRITIPSKTQAYLYTRKPIIMAMRGDAADLVREAGAGVVCNPDDPGKMKNAISILRNMTDAERKKLGDAGYRYYMEHLSFNQGVNQFERIMTALVGRPA